MILVDTSVWVSHFRRTDAHLSALLEDGRVLTHPMVVGELACGRLTRRAQVLDYLAHLEAAPVATHDEALYFIEEHDLIGRGVGYIDVHLLASVVLADGATLWSADARLAAAARRLAVGYTADR